MADMLEDGMESMMGILLANAGKPCVYSRPSTGQSATLTMHKRPQKPVVLQTGRGGLTEVLITDFIHDPTATEFAPFNPPQRDDQITVDGQTYVVAPGIGDKVYRQSADHLMRIHSKKTAT